MRIAHYYPRVMFGDKEHDAGPTRAVQIWSRALAAIGHEVVIFHAGGTRTTEEEFRSASPSFELIETLHRRWGPFLFPIGLRDQIGDVDVVILHSVYSPHNIFAARIARRANVPYVVVPHGGYDPAVRRRHPLRKRAWERIGERRMLEEAAAVHVFFETEIPYIRSLTTTPCIVAPTGFEPPVTSWAGTGDYISWLGTFDVEHKGLDILLRAIVRIPVGRRPKLRIHGIDHRQTREDLEDMVAALGLSRWVEVSGPIDGDTKIEFLKNAFGYVHPSRWESYGLALVENLALGVPCVVTRTAHIASMLEEAAAAIVVEPTDIGIAEGLERLPNSHSDLGDRGRQFIAQELDPSQTAISFTHQLEHVLAQHRSL